MDAVALALALLIALVVWSHLAVRPAPPPAARRRRRPSQRPDALTEAELSTPPPPAPRPRTIANTIADVTVATAVLLKASPIPDAAALIAATTLELCSVLDETLGLKRTITGVAESAVSVIANVGAVTAEVALRTAIAYQTASSPTPAHAGTTSPPTSLLVRRPASAILPGSLPLPDLIDAATQTDGGPPPDPAPPTASPLWLRDALLGTASLLCGPSIAELLLPPPPPLPPFRTIHVSSATYAAADATLRRSTRLSSLLPSNPSAPLHLDRDPAAFRHVLNHLRGCPLPRALDADEVDVIRAEAAWLDLVALVVECDEALKGLLEWERDSAVGLTPEPRAGWLRSRG